MGGEKRNDAEQVREEVRLKGQHQGTTEWTSLNLCFKLLLRRTLKGVDLRYTYPVKTLSDHFIKPSSSSSFGFVELFLS